MINIETTKKKHAFCAGEYKILRFRIKKVKRFNLYLLILKKPTLTPNKCIIKNKQKLDPTFTYYFRIFFLFFNLSL